MKLSIWRNTEIGLIFQRNSEILNTLWRISENRPIVEYGNFMFLRTEYGKVPILRTFVSLKQKCQGLNNVLILTSD